MIYKKRYRVRTMDSRTMDGFIIGYRATRKAALELALQQASRLSKSIEVEKRNADGGYEYVTTALNPAKFQDY